MGPKTKVSAAVLVAAVIVYFVTRTPRAESPPMAAVEPHAAVVEGVDSTVVPAFELPARSAERQRLVVEEPPAEVTGVTGTNVLRVVLEGITEEDARMTTVTLTGVDKRDGWPVEIGDSWPCQGLTSEFDLDPAFASVERLKNLRTGELEVAVEHPHHLGGRTGVSLARGVELANGKTVHEVRVRLVRPEFWP